MEADQKSLCFICDIPNHEFERKSKVNKYCNESANICQSGISFAC